MRNPLLALAQLNPAWTIHELHDPSTSEVLATAGVRNVAAYTLCFDDLLQTLRSACFRAIPGVVVIQTTRAKDLVEVYNDKGLFYGLFKDQSVRRFDRVTLKNKPVLALLNAPKLFPSVVLDAHTDASKTNLVYYSKLADFLKTHKDNLQDISKDLLQSIEEALKDGLVLADIKAPTYEQALYAYQALERKHARLLDLHEFVKVGNSPSIQPHMPPSMQVSEATRTWWADIEQHGGAAFSHNWYNKNMDFDFEFVYAKNTIPLAIERACEFLFAAKKIGFKPDVSKFDILNFDSHSDLLTNFSDAFLGFLHHLKQTGFTNNPRWIKGLDSILNQHVNSTVVLDQVFVGLALVNELRVRSLPKNPFAKPTIQPLSHQEQDYLATIQNESYEPDFAKQTTKFQLNLLGFEQAMNNLNLEVALVQAPRLDKASSVVTHEAFCCAATQLVQSQQVNLYIKLVNVGFLVLPPSHEPTWPTLYVTLRQLQDDKCAIESIDASSKESRTSHQAPINKTDTDLEDLLRKALHKFLLVVYVFGGQSTTWDDNVDLVVKRVMDTSCALQIQSMLDKINDFVASTLKGNTHQAMLLFSKAAGNNVETLLDFFPNQDALLEV